MRGWKESSGKLIIVSKGIVELVNGIESERCMRCEDLRNKSFRKVEVICENY